MFVYFNTYNGVRILKFFCKNDKNIYEINVIFLFILYYETIMYV